MSFERPGITQTTYGLLQKQNYTGVERRTTIKRSAGYYQIICSKIKPNTFKTLQNYLLSELIVTILKIKGSYVHH